MLFVIGRWQDALFGFAAIGNALIGSLQEFRAKAALDKSYAWLDVRMLGREWAANTSFGIADCAGAPALFYANWAHPIPATLKALRAYRARLHNRPSIVRVVEEARPSRSSFPLKEHPPE